MRLFTFNRNDRFYVNLARLYAIATLYDDNADTRPVQQEDSRKRWKAEHILTGASKPG